MSSGHAYTYSYNQAANRFGRSVTPMGTVPISVIWGFDYPLEDQPYARSAVRAMSEFREPMEQFHSSTTYPSFPSALTSSTSFNPSALTDRSSRPPIARSSRPPTHHVLPAHHYPRFPESHLHMTPSVPNFTKEAVSGKVFGSCSNVSTRYPSTRYQSRGPLRYSQYPRYRSRFYH